MNTRLPGSLVLLLVVSGCSGSGDPQEPGAGAPQPPPTSATEAKGGLWSGAIYWDPHDAFPGGARNVRALVAEDGEFRFVLLDDGSTDFNADSEQIFGDFIFEPQHATVNSGVWHAGSQGEDDWGDFNLASEYNPGNVIQGEWYASFDGWTHQEVRAGTFRLDYHSTYDRPSSLGVLQGTYTTPGETLSIDGLGEIFYQSSETGCTANGMARLIDSRYNMYRVSMTVDNCTGDADVRNGRSYSGLASIGDNNEPGGGFLNSTLELAVASEAIGLPMSTGYVRWSMLLQKN